MVVETWGSQTRMVKPSIQVSASLLLKSCRGHVRVLGGQPQMHRGYEALGSRPMQARAEQFPGRPQGLPHTLQANDPTMLNISKRDDEKTSCEVISSLSPTLHSCSSLTKSILGHYNFAINITTDIPFCTMKTFILPASVDKSTSSLSKADELIRNLWFCAELRPADQPGIWLRVWNHLMPENTVHDGPHDSFLSI